MTTALEDLIAAVKAGDDVAFRRANRAMFSTPCQELGLQIREENARHAYKGSLDAALELHNAVLPDEGWEVYRTSKYPGMIPGSCSSPYKAKVGWGTQFAGHADTPARAWLLAILRALEARDSTPTPALQRVKE
ncbi:MAG: hypothetical protein CML61_12375 [Rhodobacteraceae bacterium]|nr:hypothetical protein [Paracoccaceae bacterium]